MFRSGKTTFSQQKLLKNTDRYIVFDPMSEFDGFGHVVKTVKEFAEAIKKYPQLIVRPEDDSVLQLEMFVYTIQKLDLEDLLFVLDEANQYLESRKLPHYMGKLWRQGHKKGIGICLLTHRPADLPTICRMVHHILMFSTPIELDAKIMKSAMGIELPLASLPEYWFYHISKGKYQLHEPLKIR
jgi:hypothetical protein